MTGWDDDDDVSDDDSTASDDDGSIRDLNFGSHMDGMDEPLLGRSVTPQKVDTSRPYEHRWEVDVDNVDAHEQVHFYLHHPHIAYSSLLPSRDQLFANACKHTEIG